MQMHGLVASTIHLPPTCDARWDCKTFPLPGLVFFDQIRHFGARTHETHITTDHVDKLRQLVQAKAAQEFSCTRDTWIFLRFVQQVSFWVALLHLPLELL